MAKILHVPVDDHLTELGCLSGCGISLPGRKMTLVLARVNCEKCRASSAFLRKSVMRLEEAAPDLYRSVLIDEALQCIGYTEAACRWLRERGIEPPPREKLAQWQKDERRAALAKARGEMP